MKKIYLLVIALIAIATACKTEKADTGEKEAKTVQIDTFYSADLAFAQLRGPVKTCTTTTTDMVSRGDSLVVSDESATTTETLRFDQNGKILKVENRVLFLGEVVESSDYTFEYTADGECNRAYTSFEGTLRVTRYPDGMVKTFTSQDPAGSIEFAKAYTWDGKLLTEESLVNTDGGGTMSDVRNKTTYTYDDNGYRTGKQEVSGDPEFSQTITDTSYEYKDYDERGNWTSRVVTNVAKVYAGTYRGDGSLQETITTYLTETREITYYK